MLITSASTKDLIARRQEFITPVTALSFVCLFCKQQVLIQPPSPKIEWLTSSCSSATYQNIFCPNAQR